METGVCVISSGNSSSEVECPLMAFEGNPSRSSLQLDVLILKYVSSKLTQSYMTFTYKLYRFGEVLSLCLERGPGTKKFKLYN